jgi:hypothetical protein
MGIIIVIVYLTGLLRIYIFFIIIVIVYFDRFPENNFLSLAFF